VTRIAISYRRDDSAGITGRIFDRLVAYYGADSVFRDIDNIPIGVDFREHIDSILAQTDITLVVVGKRWFGPLPRRRRRIDDPADPVRVEVETALRNRIPVVPVLVEDAAMPDVDQLPDSMKDLVYRNGLQVDAGRDFEQHVERLIRSMEPILARRAKELAEEGKQQAEAVRRAEEEKQRIEVARLADEERQQAEAARQAEEERRRPEETRRAEEEKQRAEAARGEEEEQRRDAFVPASGSSKTRIVVRQQPRALWLALAAIVLIAVAVAGGGYAFYSEHQSALRAAEEKQRAEAARQTEEKQRAEAARQTEEKQRAEAARQTEEKQRAEAARQTEERQRAEAARQTEERQRAEAARQAEEEKQRAEAARQTEEKQQAEAARQAEETQRTQAVPQTGDEAFDLANNLAKKPVYSAREQELLAQISDPQQRAMAELQMFMEKQALLATTLSNTANMRHEMRKTVEKASTEDTKRGITKVLGLTLSEITLELKKRFSLAEPSTGVIVVEVVKNSEAAAKDVRPGDIIGDVSTPADLSDKVNEAKKNGQKSILLSVKRRHALRFVALHPD
jgi:TIR domain